MHVDCGVFGMRTRNRQLRRRVYRSADRVPSHSWKPTLYFLCSSGIFVSQYRQAFLCRIYRIAMHLAVSRANPRRRLLLRHGRQFVLANSLCSFDRTRRVDNGAGRRAPRAQPEHLLPRACGGRSLRGAQSATQTGRAIRIAFHERHAHLRKPVGHVRRIGHPRASYTQQPSSPPTGASARLADRTGIAAPAAFAAPAAAVAPPSSHSSSARGPTALAATRVSYTTRSACKLCSRRHLYRCLAQRLFPLLASRRACRVVRLDVCQSRGVSSAVSQTRRSANLCNVSAKRKR